MQRNSLFLKQPFPLLYQEKEICEIRFFTGVFNSFWEKISTLQLKNI
jgi:hypothetical protein